MTTYSPLDLRHAFPALAEQFLTSRAPYHPHLQAIRGERHSGVYAILDRRTRAVLYVGESHTGRLYDTITRHFRQWKRNDIPGVKRGGTMYDRAAVLVCWTTMPAKDAQDAQYAEIQRLRPRDNTVDGTGIVAGSETVERVDAYGHQYRVTREENERLERIKRELDAYPDDDDTGGIPV